jgi:hypothetical protein
MDTLGRDSGIETILMEERATNGTFLKAGLIADFSLLVYPAINGLPGVSSIVEYHGNNDDIPTAGRSLAISIPRRSKAVWFGSGIALKKAPWCLMFAADAADLFVRFHCEADCWGGHEMDCNGSNLLVRPIALFGQVAFQKPFDVNNANRELATELVPHIRHRLKVRISSLAMQSRTLIACPPISSQCIENIYQIICFNLLCICKSPI